MKRIACKLSMLSTVGMTFYPGIRSNEHVIISWGEGLKCKYEMYAIKQYQNLIYVGEYSYTKSGKSLLSNKYRILTYMYILEISFSKVNSEIILNLIYVHW